MARTCCNSNSRARLFKTSSDCSWLIIRWISARFAAVSIASSRLVLLKALIEPFALINCLSSSIRSLAINVSSL